MDERWQPCSPEGEEARAPWGCCLSSVLCPPLPGPAALPPPLLAAACFSGSLSWPGGWLCPLPESLVFSEQCGECCGVWPP